MTKVIQGAEPQHPIHCRIDCLLDEVKQDNPVLLLEVLFQPHGFCIWSRPGQQEHDGRVGQTDKGRFGHACEPLWWNREVSTTYVSNEPDALADYDHDQFHQFLKECEAQN